MKIYTKTGDKGKTSMLGGKRVFKSCLEMEVIGEVDELNTEIGLLLSFLNNDKNSKNKFQNIIENLFTIQNKLFIIGSNLASLQSEFMKSVPHLQNKDIIFLEKWIDKMDEDLLELKSFILRNGSLISSQSYKIRAVCRRAERKLIELNKKNLIDDFIKQYLNRLSDLFFTLGRWLNMKQGIKEIEWNK